VREGGARLVAGRLRDGALDELRQLATRGEAGDLDASAEGLLRDGEGLLGVARVAHRDDVPARLDVVRELVVLDDGERDVEVAGGGVAHEVRGEAREAHAGEEQPLGLQSGRRGLHPGPVARLQEVRLALDRRDEPGRIVVLEGHAGLHTRPSVKVFRPCGGQPSVAWRQPPGTAEGRQAPTLGQP
jgi:hypothetical protein